MKPLLERLRELASGEGPVPFPFEGNATWMKLTVAEAREILDLLAAKEVSAFEPNGKGGFQLTEAAKAALAAQREEMDAWWKDQEARKAAHQ